MTKSEVQQLWDLMLVSAFVRAKGAYMETVVKSFISDAQMSIEELDEQDLLPRRFPKGFQTNCVVTRYVAAYLPKLAPALWKAKESDIGRIVDTLQRLKMDTQLRAADGQSNDEMKAKHSQHDLHLAQSMYNREREARKASGRSAWSTCKA